MVDSLSSILGGKLVVVTLTSGTSWTVPDDIQGNVIWVTACGGGGGGGNDTTTTDGGGGGGGGACVIKMPIFLGTSPPATVAYSVGSGGAGGASGGLNSGSAGGGTYFGSNGHYFSLGGGRGGLSSGAGGNGGAIANAGYIGNASPSIGLDPEYTMCDRLINTASNDLGNSFGAGLAADSTTPATATSPDRGAFWGGGGGGSGAQTGTNGTAGGNGYGMGAESFSDDGGGGGSLGNGGSRNGTPDPSPGYGGGGAGSDGNEGGQTGGDGVIIIEYWDG